RRAGDSAGLEPVAQARRHQLVVDAPTDIVGARRAARAPPGVVLAFGLERAITVDPTLRAQAIHPVALGGKAAGILLVGGPVLDVHSRSDNVPVTTQNVIAAAGQP